MWIESIILKNHCYISILRWNFINNNVINAISKSMRLNLGVLASILTFWISTCFRSVGCGLRAIPSVSCVKMFMTWLLRPSFWVRDQPCSFEGAQYVRVLSYGIRDIVPTIRMWSPLPKSGRSPGCYADTGPDARAWARTGSKSKSLRDPGCRLNRSGRPILRVWSRPNTCYLPCEPLPTFLDRLLIPFVFQT